MKTRTKAAMLALCAVMLVAASVFGTLAYLTDTSSKVTNTFTVGNVDISLDEAPVDDNGQAIKGEDVQRVVENSYHLLPGHTYDKDPTIHVAANSEDAYIRIMLTINMVDKLAAVATAEKPVTYENVDTALLNIDTAHWERKTVTYANGSAVYEYRYNGTVNTMDGKAKDLEPLFTTVTIPGAVDNDTLKEINNLTIEAIGHAIQTGGFKATEELSAEDVAWQAFDAAKANAGASNG